MRGETKRRIWLAVTLAALAGALLLRPDGSPARWRSAVAFIAFCAGAATFVELAAWRMRHRAATQSPEGIPRGVRLSKPWWMRAREGLAFLGPSAALGFIPAALGVPGVGLGIVLTLAILQGGMAFIDWNLFHHGLTFEPDGLRVHIRGGTFVVAWTEISRVECKWQASHGMTWVHVTSTQSVVATTSPDTPKLRRRALFSLYDGDTPSGKLTLGPWTAGIDGAVLARALTDAADPRGARTN